MMTIIRSIILNIHDSMSLYVFSIEMENVNAIKGSTMYLMCTVSWGAQIRYEEVNTQQTD